MISDNEVKRNNLFRMMACINRHRPGYMADALDAMDLKAYCQLSGCKLDNWYETVSNDYFALLEEHIDEEHSPCREQPETPTPPSSGLASTSQTP